MLGLHGVHIRREQLTCIMTCIIRTWGFEGATAPAFAILLLKYATWSYSCWAISYASACEGQINLDLGSFNVGISSKAGSV